MISCKYQITFIIGLSVPGLTILNEVYKDKNCHFAHNVFCESCVFTFFVIHKHEVTMA